MAKYRKKPVEIEAFLFDGDFMNCNGVYYVPAWAVNAQRRGRLYFKGVELYIVTYAGIQHVSVGDYVIRGVHGEMYSCKPDIFGETYERVEE